MGEPNRYRPDAPAARTGDAGRRSERKAAQSLAARLTPASGAMKGAKGDMRIGEFLIEAKSTQHATMSLEHHWLRKIAGEALAIGKNPALSVRFTNGNGDVKPNGDWVMIPASLFKEIIEP